MGKRSRAGLALSAAVGTLVVAALPALAATSYPNDYFFANNDQWALTGSAASINAPAAWCASTGLTSSGGRILVADVDTGANFSHPDLAGKLIAGAAFLGGTAPDKDHPTGTGQAAVTDGDGHGSMTTGIMVADTNNGQGVAAVAPDAQALVVKVLDDSGSGWTTDVEYGIEWAVDHGARVINLSIGPGDVTLKSASVPDPTAQAPIVQGIQYASQHNVAVAVAAGNSGMPASSYTTLLQTSGVLTVGALGPGDQVASYSNFGYGVSVYAPGGDAPSQSASASNQVVSTYIQKNGFIYGMGEGTSFAAPQVAGALADLIALGDSAAAAASAVTSHTATSADGHKQLDAAAALGRSKTALCGSPSTGGSVPPPGGGLIGSGGKTVSATPTPRPRPAATQAPAGHTAPPAVALGTATPAPVATAEPTGGAAVPGGDAGAQAQGRTGPPAGSGGSGGGSPLLVVGLGALLLGGAPLSARVMMRLRGPRPRA